MYVNKFHALVDSISVNPDTVKVETEKSVCFATSKEAFLKALGYSGENFGKYSNTAGEFKSILSKEDDKNELI